MVQSTHRIHLFGVRRGRVEEVLLGLKATPCSPNLDVGWYDNPVFHGSLFRRRRGKYPAPRACRGILARVDTDRPQDQGEGYVFGWSSGWMH
jgi:hypothetical protein